MLVASENWGWLRIIAANLYSCVPDLFIHVCVNSYTHTNIFLLILTIMCWSGAIIITTLHTNQLRYNEVKQPSQVTQLNPDHLHPDSLYYMDSPDMALQGLSGGSRLSHPVPKLSHSVLVGHGCYHSAIPKGCNGWHPLSPYYLPGNEGSALPTLSRQFSQHLYGVGAVSSSFYIWGNWDLERLTHLFKITSQ